jgi:hypothetical protein
MARPIICNQLFLTDTDYQNIKPIPIPIIFAALISNCYRLCQKKGLIGKLTIMDNLSHTDMNTDYFILTNANTDIWNILTD